MALEFYAVSAQNAVTGTAKFGTAAEDAFRARSDVAWWFDARGRTVEASANARLVEWRSRKAKNDAQQPKLIADSEALAPYFGKDPTTGTLDEYRFGINASNVLVGGFNNRHFISDNDTCKLPATGDITIAMRARVLTPGTLSILLSTKSTATQLAIGVTSALAQRAYSDYSSGLVGATSNIPDNLYHTLVWKFDRTNNTVEMYCDTTQTRSPTAFTIPSYPDYNIRLAHVIEVSTEAGSSGFALQQITCINSIDDVSLNLFKAVIAER